MREIKFRAKPDIRASPSIGEAAYAKGQKITNTKAAIKREQCQTCLSIAEREQAQRMK